MSNAKQTSLRLPNDVLSRLGLPATEVDVVITGYVQRLDTPNGTVWLKIAESKKPAAIRRFLRAAIDLLSVPALARTPDSKGADTLLKQAGRADLLRKSGFNTPETIYVTRELYIATHAGIPLSKLAANAKRSDDLKQRKLLEKIVLQATGELSRLHEMGLAHGRPKLRDIGWMKGGNGSADDGTNFLYDLEEHPWDVMPVADAQARDIVLWLIDLCSHSATKDVAVEACSRMRASMTHETAVALCQIITRMKLVAPGARLLSVAGIGGPELRGGIAAYDLMKTQMKRIRTV